MGVLKLKDGSTEIVSTNGVDDFRDLLDRKLGMDARDFFDSIIAEYEAKISFIESNLEDDFK